MKLWYVLILSTLFFPSIMSSSVAQNKVNSASKLDKEEQLIRQFIRKSKSPMMQSCRSSQEPISWEKDQIHTTDSAVYNIYKIGRSVRDEDGSNSRFTACAWVYINVHEGQLYEYRLAEDILVRFGKR